MVFSHKSPLRERFSYRTMYIVHCTVSRASSNSIHAVACKLHAYHASVLPLPKRTVVHGRPDDMYVPDLSDGLAGCSRPPPCSRPTSITSPFSYQDIAPPSQPQIHFRCARRTEATIIFAVISIRGRPGLDARPQLCDVASLRGTGRQAVHECWHANHRIPTPQ